MRSKGLMASVFAVAVVCMAALAGPALAAKRSHAPTVTAIQPATGPDAGGTAVTITGTGFKKTTAVNFGSVGAASFTVNSATSITATSPAGTGAVDVTVTTTKGGTSATNSADQFKYPAFVCDGAVGAVEIKNEVSAGPGCDLSEAIVRGNVIVAPGGVLFTKKGTNTEITGNVEGNNAAYLHLFGRALIGGRLRATGTAEGVTVGPGSVAGNIEITGGIPEAGIFSEKVGGNVQVLNTSGEAPSAVAHVIVSESAVGGNVEFGNNSLVAQSYDFLGVVETSVAGDVVIFNNTEAQTPEGFLAFRSEAFLFANHVGGNAELLNNTGQEVFEVSKNLVTNTLNCVGDVPPPFGKENTASQKLGQCALL